jgi:rhodanese-related sulfurtransferase
MAGIGEPGSCADLLSQHKELFMPEIPRITATELKRRMDAGEDFTIVDVRNPEAWQQSDMMLPGAMRVPIDRWEENLDRIPKARPIVTYCT